MTYKTPEAMREGLRRYLLRATGCNLQESTNGKNWPCGTCTMAVLSTIGLDSTRPEYHETNPEHDRHNEIWRAILQIRDAKLTEAK